MCACMSSRPGSTVRPVRSWTVAPSGSGPSSGSTAATSPSRIVRRTPVRTSPASTSISRPARTTASVMRASIASGIGPTAEPNLTFGRCAGDPLPADTSGGSPLPTAGSKPFSDRVGPRREAPGPRAIAGRDGRVVPAGACGLCGADGRGAPLAGTRPSAPFASSLRRTSSPPPPAARAPGRSSRAPRSASSGSPWPGRTRRGASSRIRASEDRAASGSSNSR